MLDHTELILTMAVLPAIKIGAKLIILSHSELILIVVVLPDIKIGAKLIIWATLNLF